MPDAWVASDREPATDARAFAGPPLEELARGEAAPDTTPLAEGAPPSPLASISAEDTP